MRSRAPLGGDATAAAFPLGGIGTGNVSIGARGELRDWELANRPDKGRSLPFSFFAIHIDDGERAVTRVLESRMEPPFAFDQGYAASRVAGLPRFAESRMHGDYPMLRLELIDESMPVDVELIAFTPLSPLDSAESGIPAAVLRYRVTNSGERAMTVGVAGSLSNPVGIVPGSDINFPEFAGHPEFAWHDDGVIRGLKGTTDLPADDFRYGSIALTTTATDVSAKPTWLAGFWSDGVQRFWDDLREDGRLNAEAVFSLDTDPGGFLELQGVVGDVALRDALPRLRTGSLAVHRTIEPGTTADFEFQLAWSFPNRPRGWLGHIIRDDPHAHEVMRNDYAIRFIDAWHAARYLADELSRLEATTRAFTEALHHGTMPPEFSDAVSTGIATARSTTCFVVEGGLFAAWEGSFDHGGSCEGTCTHVWNYAQTVAHLFPALERSARRTEFLLETDADGRMAFRTNRVFGGSTWPMLPAVDGQLGTVVRLWRDWRFSGDDDLLTACWPAALRTIDFAFAMWDADGDGMLEARAHNTYDIEFFGAEPLSNVLLLAALRAGAAMAEHLGETANAARLAGLATSGSVLIDQRLFDGQQYAQQLEDVDEHRYQVGRGVLSDQMFGQSLAHIAGLGYVLPREHVRSALDCVMRYNFRETLIDHHNVQRTYALQDEGGLLLASWPHGGRPSIPFIYSDEVWTGVEYQVATHLLYEGHTADAGRIVDAIKARHDGIRRSPWNEPECGNHYARSMASWGLLLGWTGQQWNAARRDLSFSPATEGALTALFTTGSAWGVVKIDEPWTSIMIEVLGGELTLDSLSVAGRAYSVAEHAHLTAGETGAFALSNPAIVF